MEISYFGANCVVISYKKTRIVIDDNLDELGLKNIAKEDDILLYTSPSVVRPKLEGKAKFTVATPGEYEISGASIRGIAARSHTDPKESPSNNIIYKVIIDDTRVAVLGNIYPELSDGQLEDIGTIDVLISPVGGNGYTMDAVGAIGLIKKIEPKIVIPTHYNDPKIKYPVPQDQLEKVAKEMSMEISDTRNVLKNKGLEAIENTRLVVLNRQGK